MAIADMKQRFEREDTAEPTRVPMPERMARLEAQKNQTAGFALQFRNRAIPQVC